MQTKTAKKKRNNKNVVSVRLDAWNVVNTKGIVDISKFLNDAIRFYIYWIRKPVKIMEACKQRDKALYKWVLRKNHKYRKI